MNVTALARKLKITTSELFDILPQIGFDIGRRAIKIDDSLANKIISNWDNYRKRLAYERAKAEELKQKDELPEEKRDVKIPTSIAVKDFANLAGLNVSKVLSELIKNGIFVSMNEKIDFDTAAIIGEDLNLEVILDETGDDAGAEGEEKIKNILAAEKKEELQERPPVIVVMGHVDHGKTKLLDAIRETNVVDKEAGGITQHIGAYQIEREGKPVTFIDTPGHEIFTAMRSRGAKVADVAILVVAADDGVKPQTTEAFRIIEQSKIPYLVAINKIDKPDADVERTKNELSSKLKITSEDWGGKTMMLPISAKEKQGIEELLDSVLLLTEVEKENRIANPDATAVGTVIESHVDRGEGPVATILIQNGSLRVGDVICLDESPLGKVRVMKDHQGQNVSVAAPAMPVKIAGLKVAPNIGDIIEVADKKLRLNKIKKNKGQSMATQQLTESENNKFDSVKVIIKSDVLGSLEAIEESLERLNTENVKVKIIKKGLGNITEGDIHDALASQAVVIGFNASAPGAVQQLARDEHIEIKNYSIIYELVDFVKEKMKSSLGKETIRTELGKIKVLAIFRTETKSQIIGGRVEEGTIEPDSKATVLRDDKFIAEGKVGEIQSGKQSVKQVEQGQECGLQYNGDPVVAVNDILRIYKEKLVNKKFDQ